MHRRRPLRLFTTATLLLLALVLAGCDNDDRDDFFELPTARMNWILYDECNDGRGLQASLFESETGRVYPSRDSVYVAGPGSAIDVEITCRDGAQVCYGAETDPPSGIFWGVGLDGDRGCDDCCDVCRDNVVEFELFCDGSFVGAAPQASEVAPAVTPVRGESRRPVRSTNGD